MPSGDHKVFQSTCPRGARPVVGVSYSGGGYFNPRAHEGHDFIINLCHFPTRFQSTCPRGARRYQVCGIVCRGNFNPRAHEGHDVTPLFMTVTRFISIHVPTRGTTTTLLLHSHFKPFQSTCPRGARLGNTIAFYQTKDFNPRAHEGHDDSAKYCVLRGGRISIHVPTRGTTYTILCVQLANDFNPRAHEGHDVKYNSAASLFAFQSTCPRGARQCPRKNGAGHCISIHVPTRGTTSWHTS